MKRLSACLMLTLITGLKAIGPDYLKHKIDDIQNTISVAYQNVGVTISNDAFSFKKKRALDVKRGQAAQFWRNKSVAEKIEAMKKAQAFLVEEKASTSHYEQHVQSAISKLDAQFANVRSSLQGDQGTDLETLEQQLNDISYKSQDLADETKYLETLKAIAYHQHILERGNRVGFRIQRSLHEGLHSIKKALGFKWAGPER